MLATVIGTLYRMILPGIVKPSMAMKCMTQIPVTPIEIAPTRSQRTRAAPVQARDRAVHRRPRNEPRNDIRYARTGVSAP